MLLLFVTILVNSDDIDLFRKNVAQGEIYTRLLRCVYRKFVVRKGKTFKAGDFVTVLKLLGKIAWKTLNTKQYHFQMKQVLIGDVDIFEYGIITGHQDFHLVGHETADVFISYPHRTFQEFLGAFHFTHKMSIIEQPGRYVSQYCRESILGIYSFLHFCLWFLSDVSERGYFTFPQVEGVQNQIEACIAAKINSIELNLTNIFQMFPALNIYSAHKINDWLVLDTCRRAIASCTKIRRVLLSSIDPADWLLDFIRPAIPNLSTIELVENPSARLVASSLSECVLRADDLNVIIATENFSGSQSLLSQCSGLAKLPSLYLVLTGFDQNGELSGHVRPGIDKLSAFNLFYNNSLNSFKTTFRCVPSLTHISLIGMYLDSSVVTALGKAVKNGCLPSLNHMSLAGCGDSLKDKLHKLFEHPWPKLNYLNLNNCVLNGEDIDFMSSTFGSEENHLLPEVRTLLIQLGDDAKDLIPQETCFLNTYARWRSEIRDAVRSLFQRPWPLLSKLWLRNVSKDEYKMAITALNAGGLPDLTDLTISMGTRSIAQKSSGSPWNMRP